MLTVRIMGAKEAEAWLARLQGGCKAADGPVARVGTHLKYAFGIEFGRHRGGKLARRAGGSFALTGSFLRVQPRIKPTLAEALPKGPGATLQALKALGLQVLAGTLDILTNTVYATPIPVSRTGKPRWRRTGNLRRSYHMQLEP